MHGDSCRLTDLLVFWVFSPRLDISPIGASQLLSYCFCWSFTSSEIPIQQRRESAMEVMQVQLRYILPGHKPSLILFVAQRTCAGFSRVSSCPSAVPSSDSSFTSHSIKHATGFEANNCSIHFFVFHFCLAPAQSAYQSNPALLGEGLF